MFVLKSWMRNIERGYDMKGDRNSSVELLRILSMLTIVGVHYWGCCGTLDKISPKDSSYEVMKVLELLFSYGVNIFVIITGYFMIDRMEVNFRKAFDLLWQIAFYGSILFFVSVAISINSFSLGGLLKSIFPILGGLRWFVKAYIILYVLAPYINRLLNSTSQKSHRLLIVILCLLFSVWPFLLPYPPVDDYGFGYSNFIVLYVIAGYLKKYVQQIHVGKCLAFFVVSSSLLFFLMHVETNLPVLVTMKTMALAHNSPIKLVACFSLFLMFVRMTWYNKAVNILAASAFSVYVIHGDFNTMEWMFTDLLRSKDYQEAWIWLPHFLCVLVVVYVVCFVIDTAVRHTVGRIWTKIFDRIRWLNFRISA